MNNGTKPNEGAATLTLQKDRNINMHLYTSLPRGAYFKLIYTKRGETNQKELVFTKPTGLSTFWQYTDTDSVLTGAANRSILQSGGNFYINTKALEPGKDIVVEAYDKDGNKIADHTSSFKYIKFDTTSETVKHLTWTDHSDKKAVLSINKSLYTPYQVLFTNDYAEGTDDFYKDPRVLPAEGKDFNTDTKQIVGYTKYDGGKVRTLYEEGTTGKLFGKVEAASDDYNDKGDLTKDNSSKVSIKKENVFDPQFKGAEKIYKAYKYTFDLTKMLPWHSDDKTETPLTLLKDMKFVSTASDGSSLPSDLLETRVRARVLFDTTEGAWADNTNKAVKIVPDNFKFYGEDGYVANGFEGEGADTNTGDKFPDAPKSGTKTFLGWVTEDGKTALGKTTVTTAEFNALNKDKVFTNTTPVEKHLVVYAIYTEDKVVTFYANGGKFTDGKDEMTKQSSDLANVEEPKREGYTFKGWADTKDATTADPDILKNVSDSKTVYAVWEQEADKKLNLNPPKPVPVKDKTDLTEDEKDAVKQAVIDANSTLGLTKDMITVGSDGKVTVKTKDGKTGELTPDKTVKQKEVINNINPPEKPIEVKNPSGLTNDEKNKVKEAIKKANPDLHLEDGDITVDADGKVTINKGGKIGEVPANKTVVEESKIIDLKAPTPVEVKDVNNLTKAEKEAVAKAVKEKNSLPETAKINVDGNGNVTVTDGDKTGKLEGKDTVKPFDRTGKTLNNPKELTEVSDKSNLTEAEKDAVREAVKSANPDLNFKDDEIQVDANGKVTVPMGTDNTGNPKFESIEPENTVKADDKTKTISLKAPAKTYVKDPSSLTKEEKEAVKQAVLTANNTSGLTLNDITVADDGSVIVTKGNKTGMLAQADTVVKKLDPPKVAKDDDGTVVVGPKDDRTSEIEVTYTGTNDAEQKVIAKKDSTTGEWKVDPAVDGVEINKKSGLISIPASKIKNGTDVKAVAKDGDNTSDDNKITSEDKQAPANPEIAEDDKGNVTITIPKDKDLKTVNVTYTPEGQDNPVTVTLTKDGDSWTTTDDNVKVVDGRITIPDDKIKNGTKVSAKAVDANGNESSEPGITTKTTADRTDPIIPAKTPVADLTNLTQPEKDTIKKAIEDANSFPTGTDVSVGTDGTVTITYPDGSTDTIPAASLVEKVDKTKLQEEVDKNNNDAIKNSDKYTNADQDKKDAYDSALDKAKKVLNDPAAKQKDVDEALQALKDAEAALDGTAEKPTITNGKAENDPSKTTTTVSGKTKPNTEVTIKLADGTEKKVTSDENGDFTAEVTKQAKDAEITITPKDGTASTIKVTDKATPGANIKAPTTQIKVDNSKALTDDEKAAVKKAVEDANKDAGGNSTLPKGSTIDVADDGTVTVTDKDGKVIGTIKPDKTVEQKADGLPVQPADPIPVENPDHLTDAEKAAIKEAIKEVNSHDLDDANIEVADDGTVTVTKNGKKATIPANRTRKAMPRPDYADIYYPDTTIGVGDERRIYPSGYPGYVSTLPGDIDAPRGVYVRVNHDGSIDVEVSPRYTGPSMFTITGYVDVDGKIAPISIRIRVIDDVRSDRRRQRMDKRDEMDKEDELIDTREVLTHKAYIFGYPDGTVRPNGFITRAEAAAMLSRLLNEENTSSAAKPAFIDTPSKWYNNAINAVVARGIMRGYSDGTFKPNAPITRAEFAQMISAIDAKPFGTAPFNDVKGHWAELAIGKEYAAGRISGYPNGTFRPDAPITRAEAAHILNKIFERNYDLVSALQSNDKGNIKFFTDLSTSFWGYNDMVEATNTHTFRRRSKGLVQEDWDNINR